MLWGSVLVATAAVYVFFAALTPRAHGPGMVTRTCAHLSCKSRAHRNCIQVSVQPTVMWCGRRGYVWQDGAWYDQGDLRPGALVKGTPAN